jgi:outer membrane protein TolC
MKKLYQLTAEDISKELKKYPDIKLAEKTVDSALTNVRRRLEREGYDIDDEEDDKKT